jgi:uncharacterized RDD family membrane protein YckC
METNSENYLGQYAGFASRLIAYLIDTIIAVASITVIWWLLELTIQLLKIREIINALGLEDQLDFAFNPNDDFVWRGFAFIFGVGLYHVFFLTLANRTIGKALMGLQVVPMSGGRIGILRATLRYLGYIVSIIPLFFGFIWILLSNKRQGWHDKLAGTCVVYTWEAEPDDAFLKRALARLQKANEKRFGSTLEAED